MCFSWGSHIQKGFSRTCCQRSPTQNKSYIFYHPPANRYVQRPIASAIFSLWPRTRVKASSRVEVGPHSSPLKSLTKDDMFSLVGGFKDFLCSPRTLGKMNPFWGAYFSTTNFTHQPVEGNSPKWWCRILGIGPKSYKKFSFSLGIIVNFLYLYLGNWSILTCKYFFQMGWFKIWPVGRSRFLYWRMAVYDSRVGTMLAMISH